MTPADIDAVLPRVATWPPKLYDLTDPDERAEAVAWLWALCREAAEIDWHRSQAMTDELTDTARRRIAELRAETPPESRESDEPGSVGTVGAGVTETSSWVDMLERIGRRSDRRAVALMTRAEHARFSAGLMLKHADRFYGKPIEIIDEEHA